MGEVLFYSQEYIYEKIENLAPTLPSEALVAHCSTRSAEEQIGNAPATSGGLLALSRTRVISSKALQRARISSLVKL